MSSSSSFSSKTPLVLSILEQTSSLCKEELDEILSVNSNSVTSPSVGLIEIPDGLCYIQREKAAIHGKIIKIRRIFVEVCDSGDYKSVGWIAKCDVNNCLVCSKTFGLFTYKYHCYACGNVICHQCSNNTAIINELTSIFNECKTVRVCRLCFWGQKIVTAVHTFEDREFTNLPQYLNAIKKTPLLLENAISRIQRTPGQFNEKYI